MTKNCNRPLVPTQFEAREWCPKYGCAFPFLVFLLNGNGFSFSIFTQPKRWSQIWKRISVFMKKSNSHALSKETVFPNMSLYFRFLRWARKTSTKNTPCGRGSGDRKGRAKQAPKIPAGGWLVYSDDACGRKLNKHSRDYELLEMSAFGLQQKQRRMTMKATMASHGWAHPPKSKNGK